MRTPVYCTHEGCENVYYRPDNIVPSAKPWRCPNHIQEQGLASRVDIDLIALATFKEMVSAYTHTMYSEPHCVKLLIGALTSVANEATREVRAALEEINPFFKAWGDGDTDEMARTLGVINRAREKYPLEKS